jgi:hypothetical protein
MPGFILYNRYIQNSKKNINTAHLLDKQKMGQMLGKEERSVMAVQIGLLADSLLNELHKYRQLVREN